MRRATEARLRTEPVGLVGALGPGATGSASAGHSVNRYALLGEIAAGGMATVHLARLRGASGFERIVAVKRCHPHLRSDPHFQAMLVDEARLAANIHHPNVVATLDVIPGEALSVVMEYVEGGPLSELITWTRSRGAQLPLEVVLRLTLDLLQGLHAAHTLHGSDGTSLGLVHRDVSPQNVLVSTDGVARLADFGVAKANARTAVTGEGQIKGKVPYLAPEVLLGSPITAQLDLYAAGVVLWEALTCTRLFAADSESELWDRVLRGVIPAPSSVRAELPPAVDALVLRSLDRDPARRPASALAFAEAVEQTGAALGIRIASQRSVALLAHQAFAETIARHRALCAAPVRPTGTALPALVPASEPATRSRAAKIALLVAGTLAVGGGAWWAGRAQRAASLGASAGTAPSRQVVAQPGAQAPAARPVGAPLERRAQGAGLTPAATSAATVPTATGPQSPGPSPAMGTAGPATAAAASGPQGSGPSTTGTDGSVTSTAASQLPGPSPVTGTAAAATTAAASALQGSEPSPAKGSAAPATGTPVPTPDGALLTPTAPPASAALVRRDSPPGATAPAPASAPSPSTALLPSRPSRATDRAPTPHHRKTVRRHRRHAAQHPSLKKKPHSGAAAKPSSTTPYEPDGI